MSTTHDEALKLARESIETFEEERADGISAHCRSTSTAEVLLARALIAADAELRQLREALGNVLWMTGGAADREQMQSIRDYVADTLDPPRAPSGTPEDATAPFPAPKWSCQSCGKLLPFDPIGTAGLCFKCCEEQPEDATASRLVENALAADAFQDTIAALWTLPNFQHTIGNSVADDVRDYARILIHGQPTPEPASEKVER